ncbi:hypothetical protein EDD37DRAFT_641619 [Exophiala viscosa]|uniref:uncharacterized protein n=1 Tax=Exophiala viscosa TaxID=2486360 RepID=UPI0021A12861|nr:hypothetical protein EDD37DRAFT_641619 [Exophiala viscosa]
MAEAVAGLYAVETLVEGAAVGAFAVSRPTAPLHLSFRRIPPSAKDGGLARSGHALNIVRGKAYVIGGQGQSSSSSSSEGDSSILAITLPVASSSDAQDLPSDIEIIHPVFKNDNRPLAPNSEPETGSRTSFTFNRTGHTTTAIGDKLYIWGGKGTTPDQTVDDVPPQSSDHFVVFDTLTSAYSILPADTTKCRDGLPPPRTSHSATSTPHPQPGSLPDGPRIDAHGTIFIHGGSANNTTLRDTWAFDVGSRAWTHFPDIPEPGPSEVANEGRITYVNSRLWRLGDGFGRAMYLDLAEHDPAPDPNPHLPGGPMSKDSSVLGVGLKGDGKWQVISFGTEATGGSSSTSTNASSLPMPRLSAGLVPVTTGSGRRYLVYFMGRELKTGLNDFWSFQIQSDDTSGAGLKDMVRDVVSKAKSSWGSGEHSWAKCEMAKADAKSLTSEEREKRPEDSSGWPEGLHEFASDVWNDQGGNVFIIWGGRRGDNAVDEGWAVTVQ